MNNASRAKSLETQSSLDDVLTTAELARRPSRPPDHAAESRTLVDLAGVMAESPGTALQKLVERALAITGADSAGISILEGEDGKRVFRWGATAGAFFPFAGSKLPREFSPCGVVLDRNATQLMSEPARFYPYIGDLRPRVAEVLLVPFHSGEEPVGTVWVVAHTDAKRFDAEDARLVTSLSKFAAAAVKVAAQVTAQGVLNAEIQRQVRVFDTTLSAITDFAYIFDRDGRFVYVNKALLDLWGLKLEQAVGKNFFDLKYPDELAGKLQRQIQQVIDTRQVLRDETPYTSPTGKGGYYEYIFSPVFAADGTVEVVAGSTRDITERKRLSLAVAHQHATLAAIFEQAPAFICTLKGPDLVFELANERYYEIVGRREIIGKPVREGLPEIEGQGFFELLDNVYRTGETFSGNELPVLLSRKGDGSLDRRYMNLVYQAIREPDGGVSGVFVHGVDVTELVLARQMAIESTERLRASEERLAFSLNAAELGTFHCPMPLGRIEWNEKCKEHFWLPPDAEVDFELFYSLLHPDDRERTRRTVEESVFEQKPYDIEYRTVSKDGRERWVRAFGRSFYDAGGKPTRFDGVTMDITARKRAEEALLAARDEAEAASRAKDKFLAVLSHELRTPLSPVVMTIPAMELDPELPFKFRDDLAMVRRNIDLEVKLIDDLLDLSRVTSGKLRLQVQPVGVHEVLRHAIRSSMSDTTGKRLIVREELRAANDRLSADPARLQQVFWNLLRNAAKFTPEGGEIVVRTRNAEGGDLIVEVADTGVGIEPHALPRVFDAFEQGEVGTTRQFGGLGLGLAIAKAVVEMHGGTISAASEGKDRGATFAVRLNTLAPPVGNAESVHPVAEGSARSLKRARVLLVEDHPDTARTMARLLEASGYAVTTAASVASALQAAASEPFDVVVSDIGLPDATGYDLMRQIRDRHRIKGIALSGYGMEEDMRKSREAGFVEHVVKPVNIAQLEAVIRRVAAQRAE